uniref:Beta-lactamase-related domain-containing protein n=1 Tax=Onchocerca volvulus TaxID=6282 RepID=A0A8R1TUA9_ONCVO
MRWHHSLALPISITGIALGLSTDRQSFDTPKYFEQKEKAAAIVKQFMVRNGVPGLSVGVSHNGRCVWEQGFGYADVEQLVPCKSDTVMRIASISKSVTAALAARLVQSGKLDLDAPIQDYVPDFPKKKYNEKDVTITTRQLLSHTSGIRHYKTVIFSCYTHPSLSFCRNFRFVPTEHIWVTQCTELKHQAYDVESEKEVEFLDRKHNKIGDETDCPQISATGTYSSYSIYRCESMKQFTTFVSRCENFSGSLRFVSVIFLDLFFVLQPDEPTVEDFVKELRKAVETGTDDNVKNLLDRINIKYKEKYCKSNSTRYESVDLKDNSEFFSNVHYECVKDALEIFKNDELVAEPGSKFRYTTHGFTLLSAALEKAANKSYVDQIRNLFHELGMNHSYLDFNFPLIANRARYYYRDADHKLKNVPEVDNSSKWAGGGLLSTVTDLLIFANAMLYSYHAAQQLSTENNGMKPLLDAETMKTFWKGEISDHRGHVYALGWYKIDGYDQKYGGLSDAWPRNGVFLHTGAAVGASSVLLIKPDHNFTGANGTCVAILTNLHQCSELTQLAMEIVEIFDSATSTETS